MRLDPRTHAVRGDLADVRLADQVFAPHYALPIACLVSVATALHSRWDDGELLAELAPGEAFALLELAGGSAWGIAEGAGLVGYCDRTALALA
ncbi:SH3 domain-containing protein [Sphingomonas sp.]|uniref:SH3 domain-containing protein n=1 Tax=Sphingomonas sp. TaxID=28214 RepID=UPI003CC58041